MKRTHKVTQPAGDSWLEHEFGLTLTVPEIGQRYEIYDQLGAGGAAQVYIGYDRDLARQVAIKILRAHRRASRDAVVRFLNEARITARLQHPGIVPIHDIGLIDGELFYSMEKVEGVTFRDLFDARRRNEKDARTLDEMIRHFEQSCQIVAYAHSKGVVHRDLKPGNLMTGDFNKVYVMDWGLAIDSQQGNRLTEALQACMSKGAMDTTVNESRRLAGTPAYMAPEQIVGSQDQSAPHSDVFALGIILYELLAGKHPFERETMRDTMHAIKNDTPPPIKAAVNRDLKLVCAKALAKLPEQRYANAGELADDIRRAMTQYPVTARRNRLTAHVIKYGRRNWILALMVIALACSAYYVMSSQQRQQAEVTQWLSLAAEHIRSARERGGVGDEIESRLQVAQPAFRDSLRRNLYEVRSRELSDRISARIFLTLAVQRRAADVPPWAMTWLKELWLADLERELEFGNRRVANDIHHELAGKVDLDRLFSFTDDERQRLEAIRQQLTANKL